MSTTDHIKEIALASGTCTDVLATTSGFVYFIFMGYRYIVTSDVTGKVVMTKMSNRARTEFPTTWHFAQHLKVEEAA